MRRLADTVFGIAIACLVVSAGWLTLHPRGGLPASDAVFDMIVVAPALGFAVLGRLITDRAHNRVGLVFLSMAFGGALLGLTDVVLRSTAAPYPAWLGWLGVVEMLCLTLIIGAMSILPLVFPSGSLPSPWWRWAWWLWVLGIVAIACSTLFGEFDVNVDGLQNPIGLHAPGLLRPIGTVGGLLMVTTVIAGIASLVVRARRGSAETKAQVRWLALAGSLALVGFLLAGVGEALQGDTSSIGTIGWSLFLLSLIVGIPVAIAIAVFRYRLYDIDLVIRKTVVIGLLAVFITVVYVGIVVGIGSLFSGTLALQIAATAMVAIAFQPVRERANRLANRLVYGRRATPYEVLARFAGRIGDTYASEDVVDRIAHVIADGTGSERAEVWLLLGDELRLTGAWPSADTRSVPLVDGALPDLDGDRAATVRHLGETLGAIAIAKPAGETLTPNEADLLDRLADQSGLVLANVRLTADLEARLDQIARQAAELRASRQRIVAAQDEERRRLERNIHDGAQQHLVALAVKLRLARTMLERDPARGRTMLREIGGEIDAARDTIHSLSLGIYPPHLEAEGIAVALAAQYERGTLPIRMDADGLGRYPIDIEAAVYFCVLEALQNAAKYAEASRIDVRLRELDGAITFEVRDNGHGFDPSANGTGTGLAGMRDRLAVFGGSAVIRSAPGQGTVVSGGVPVPSEVPA